MLLITELYNRPERTCEEQNVDVAQYTIFHFPYLWNSYMFNITQRKLTIININFTNCDFELLVNSFHETTHDPEYHTIHICLTLYPLISALTGGWTLVGNVVYPTPDHTIPEMNDCRIISNCSTNTWHFQPKHLARWNRECHSPS